MSTKLTISIASIRRTLNAITPLFPKGVKQVPLGLHLRAKKLIITFSVGCVFEDEIPVFGDNEDVLERTIMYNNILPILTGDFCVLEVNPYGITLSGDDFSADFPNGYSIVNLAEFPQVQYTDIDSQSYVPNIGLLLGMSLDRLYMKDVDTCIFDKVATLKYDNTWVQVRLLGLSLNSQINKEHLRLISRFQPKQVGFVDSNTMLLKNDSARILLPRKELREKNNFTDMMENLGAPITLYTEGYIEKLRNLAKMDNKKHCSITLFEAGLTTSVRVDNAEYSVKMGDVGGKVIESMKLPLQIWMAFIKATKSDKAQFLVGGDIFCVRTTEIIILTRVLR